LKWNLESKEKNSFTINASEVLVAMTNYQGPLITGMQGLSSPDFSRCLVMLIPIPELPINVAKFLPCTVLFRSILKVEAASASEICN
jgi:hypothetical protein